MKCNKCEHMGKYTLADDECGAGNSVFHCRKGHWENSSIEEFEEEFQGKEMTDPWEDCDDFGKKSQK